MVFSTRTAEPRRRGGNEERHPIAGIDADRVIDRIADEDHRPVVVDKASLGHVAHGR
jgi:hypothetical protein